MNKKLLAIAVGAAISIPTVALAKGPTVYGKVNISLEQESVDPAPAPAVPQEQDDAWVLDSNASRLGVKGDFDLDVGGLSAIYKAEYEIAVDDGNAVFKQRNIYGGLKGGFGTLMAGNFDTPTKTAQGKIDQFNDIDGDIKNIMAGELRVANIIQYSTPQIAEALTINAAFIPNENNDDFDGDGETENGLADSTSLSVVFESGGIYAAVARDMDILDGLEVDTENGTGTVDITRLVGAFKTDVFEVGALYQIAEEAEGDGEDSSIVLSGAFKIDRIKLKAQFGKTEGAENDEEATLTALGADYKLAKASKAYVYLSKVEFDLADTEAQTIGLGLEHKF